MPNISLYQSCQPDFMIYWNSFFMQLHKRNTVNVTILISCFSQIVKTIWFCFKGGLGRKHLLDHHSNEPFKERRSTYNLEYSQPFKMQYSRYQPRKWDRHRCAWVPERLDLHLPSK